MMESFYLWPDRPLASIAVLWAVSVVLLWAAREPMQRLLLGLREALEDGLGSLGEWCGKSSHEMRERHKAALLASGTLDAQSKLDREFHRIESMFTEKLNQYAGLHRRTDDLLQQLDSDYQRCGDAPPEVPGWSSAVEAMSGIAAAGDPNVQKVLEGIQRSSEDAERRALASYRGEMAKRHKILSGMASGWKEVRGLLARMKDSVAKALESTQRINGYIDEYEQIRDEKAEAARALNYSALKMFVVSLLVIGIAGGGAFINFQLIALPMSELVPAGARLGGIPVATVSALVIVLMETALGIFIMDMLGITDLFPKLAGIPASKRRMILGLALTGLFMLAAVESSLAVLREQIVEADAALKHALAGVENTAVVRASSSNIPVIGQAVLGFVLPWILATVAIPLEMLLDSGRHVAASFAAGLLALAGSLSVVAARLAGHGGRFLGHAYDVYIGVPLRIERMVTGREPRAGQVRARGEVSA